MLHNLDSVNLELLRTFIVAANVPTFAQAARQRSVTVSAVSQQIKTLEHQLGLLLFERVGRRVRLTPAGRVLAQRTGPHLAALGQTVEELVGANARIAGRVVIGGPRTFGAHFVAPRLIALLRREPDLRLEQRFDVPSVLERRLLDAHLDLAILSRPVETGGLSATALALETFLCVAAPSLLATLPKERHERALRTWPWLVFDHDLPMHLHWWKTTFGKTHPPNNVIAHLASLELLEAFAIAGLGVTILPDYLVAPSLSRQTLISVDRSLRPRRAARNTLFLAWRTGAPMTARLQAVMRALVAPLG